MIKGKLITSILLGVEKMGLHVYLVFNGNAEDAINFYKEVFDSSEIQIHRFSDMPGFENYTPEGYEN